MAHDNECGWKAGPMPPDTYFWGGVVLHGASPHAGFHLAEFCGDHVKLVSLDSDERRRVEGHEIAYYNNSLTWPIPQDVRDDLQDRVAGAT